MLISLGEVAFECGDQQVEVVFANAAAHLDGEVEFVVFTFVLTLVVGCPVDVECRVATVAHVGINFALCGRWKIESGRLKEVGRSSPPPYAQRGGKGIEGVEIVEGPYPTVEAEPAGVTLGRLRERGGAIEARCAAVVDFVSNAQGAGRGGAIPGEASACTTVHAKAAFGVGDVAVQVVGAGADAGRDTSGKTF